MLQIVDLFRGEGPDNCMGASAPRDTVVPVLLVVTDTNSSLANYIDQSSSIGLESFQCVSNLSNDLRRWGSSRHLRKSLISGWCTKILFCFEASNTKHSFLWQRRYTTNNIGTWNTKPKAILHWSAYLLWITFHVCLLCGSKDLRWHSEYASHHDARGWRFMDVFCDFVPQTLKSILREHHTLEWNLPLQINPHRERTWGVSIKSFLRQCSNESRASFKF